MVKVHCNEGIAIHIGPKPCAGRREAASEASVGVGAGQVLSRVSINSRAPTRSTTRKAIRQGAHLASTRSSAWSKTLACAEALCFGNREISGLTACLWEAARIGKARSRSR